MLSEALHMDCSVLMEAGWMLISLPSVRRANGELGSRQRPSEPGPTCSKPERAASNLRAVIKVPGILLSLPHLAQRTTASLSYASPCVDYFVVVFSLLSSVPSSGTLSPRSFTLPLLVRLPYSLRPRSLLSAARAARPISSICLLPSPVF